MPVEILLRTAYFIQFLRALNFSFRKGSWSSVQSVINQPAFAESSEEALLLSGPLSSLWTHRNFISEWDWSEGEGELQPEQTSARSHRLLSCSTSPARAIPNHTCLQAEAVEDVSDKLGPDLKKVFKHFVWALNCLSAKMSVDFSGHSKIRSFWTESVTILNEAVRNMSHEFIIPGNKSLGIHNDKRRNNRHNSPRDLKALCSHYLEFFMIAEEKAEFCLFVSNE